MLSAARRASSSNETAPFPAWALATCSHSVRQESLGTHAQDARSEMTVVVIFLGEV